MIYMIVYSKMKCLGTVEKNLYSLLIIYLSYKTPLKGNELMTNSIIPTNDNFYSCKSSHVL